MKNLNNIIITSDGIIGTEFSQEFIAENFANKRVLIVDNGTTNNSNAKTIPENMKKFQKYGCLIVDQATLTNNNLNEIFNYDICYLMGGFIGNLLDLIQNTNFERKIKEFLKKGIYIGESAAGIILGQDIEWYFELKRNPNLQKVKPKYNAEFKSYKGLELINEIIYPHFDKENESTKNVIKKHAIPLNDGDYILKNFNSK